MLTGEVGSSEEQDLRILEYAMELCRQLNAPPKINPERVYWRSKQRVSVPGPRVASSANVPIPSDFCLIGRNYIVLPADMLGRLEPEEWRPLLASSLILELRIKKLVPHLMVRLFAPFAAGFPGGIILASVLIYSFPQVPRAGQIGFLTGFFSAFLVAFALDTHYSAPKMKQAYLKADTEAAKLVGIESLLQVLRKIDAMNLKDIDWLKKGGRGAMWTGRPSISERIQNLASPPAVDLQAK